MKDTLYSETLGLLQERGVLAVRSGSHRIDLLLLYGDLALKLSRPIEAGWGLFFANEVQG
jgi:hypothetical protein